MHNTQRKRTKKLAAAAVLSALGVVILYLASIFEMIDLSVTMFASFLCAFAVEELRGRYPLLIYAVTGILALLLLPQKFCALVYLLFFGIYPVLRPLLLRLPRLLSWLLRLALFNVSLLLLVLFCRYFLPELAAEGFGLLLFGAANAAFVVYDILLTMLLRLYQLKYRKLLGLYRFFS